MEWTSRHVLILLLILMASLGVLGAAVTYQYWYVLETQTVPVKAEVVSGQHIGLNVARELDFGKVPLEGRGSRRVTMESKVPAMAIITIDGMEGLLAVSENRVLLTPNSPQQVEFVITTTNTTALGNYTGTVTIKYVRRT